jgi:N4-gp56 family major capsid protein
MSVTTPTNVDTSIPELWAKAVLRDHLYAGFWKNMIGAEGSSNPIVQKTELLNNPGDTIHIQTTGALSGTGVSGDTTQLVGSEENLTTAEKLVVPVLYRHAVRVNRRANKKSIIDLRSEAQMRLAEWGEQKMDTVRFANFIQTANLNGASYTPNVMVVNGGTGVADAGTGDKLSVQAIQQARLTLYNNRAKPIKASGVPVFAAIVHPNSLYALKREDEYSSWVREAQVRGDSNPFFQGAAAMIDGVVLFEHPNVPVSATGGANTQPVSKNIFFGAEAFVEGVDENVSWAEDEFDYGLEFGIAYSFAFQPRRGLEQNSLQVYADATTPTA